MQVKSGPVEFKIDQDRRTFEGYAAVFGNIDEGGDRIKQGAFKKTLSERFPKKMIKTLWLHCDPLGMPLEFKEDDHGLFFRSSVSQTTLGNDSLELMRDGVVNQMSFGYDIIKAETTVEDKEEILELIELKLFEISPVLWPMNEQTAITAVKALISAAPLPENVKALLELAARLGTEKKTDKPADSDSNILLIRTEQAAQEFLARLEDMKALGTQPGKSTEGNEPLLLSEIFAPFCALTKEFQLHS